MSEFDAAALLWWRPDGTAVMRPLAYGSEAACRDVARRCSAGCPDWPAIAVRERNGPVRSWWARGEKLAAAPQPPEAATRRARH